MTIIDRYVSRSFLFALVIFSSSFMALYIVADFMIMLKDQKGLSVGNIFNHYLVHTPMFLYRLAPFLVLMAAVFTITRMNRLSELVPIRAAGISLFRTCAPLFVLAFAIGLGLTFFQEFYVPGLADKIRASAEGKELKPPLMKDGQGNTFLVRWYYIATKNMSNVYLHQAREDGSMHIEARNATWETLDGETGWRFKNGRKFMYDKSGRLKEKDGRAVIEDLPKEGLFIISDLAPAEIESAEQAAAYLSIGDLRSQYAKNPHLHHLNVEVHVRITYPLTFLVLLLIGLPCVLIPETRNMFVGIGFCLFICLCYIIVFVFFTDLGNRGTLSPIVAAWMPLVAAFSFGVVMFDSIRT